MFMKREKYIVIIDPKPTKPICCGSWVRILKELLLKVLAKVSLIRIYKSGTWKSSIARYTLTTCIKCTKENQVKINLRWFTQRLKTQKGKGYPPGESWGSE